MLLLLLFANACIQFSYEKCPFAHRVERAATQGSTAAPVESKCNISIKPCSAYKRLGPLGGACNNLKHPKYGAVGEAPRRLLPAEYGDGRGSPRSKSVFEKDLPSPRVVSNDYMNDKGKESVPDPLPVEHLHMVFGQFVAHDVMLTHAASGSYGEDLDCASCSSSSNSDCFPIPVPKKDPFFPEKKENGEKRCLGMTRAANVGAKNVKRTQINDQTSYVDLSLVYGRNECEGRKLRTLKGGAMKMISVNGYSLLPQNLDKDPGCKSKAKYPCFLAGDPRNSVHPGLLLLHTLFVKQHNVIASQLSKLNSSLSDEEVYQIVRRFMVSWYQNIVYGEYLPPLLGDKLMKQFGLNREKRGYFTGYNSAVSAQLSLEFAYAAFRFGHSQIRSDYPRTNNANQTVAPPLQLAGNYFYTDQAYDNATGNLQSIAEGFQSVPAQRTDRFFSFATRNQLLSDRKIKYSGNDLAAIDIARGREVGLPGYNKYRPLAGLKRANSFYNFENIPVDNRYALTKVYTSADDVDLYVGLLSENRPKDALVGQTAGYIIAEQFQRLKRGDRFYFENQGTKNYIAHKPGLMLWLKNPPSESLKQIRKLTLHKLLCENFPGMKLVREDFYFSSKRVPCTSLTGVDIKLLI